MRIVLFLDVLYRALSFYSYFDTLIGTSKSWLHEYLTFPMQALPSLIISVIGLIVAGVLMDKFQV